MCDVQIVSEDVKLAPKNLSADNSRHCRGGPTRQCICDLVRNGKQAVFRGLDLCLSEGLELERKLAMGLRGYTRV